MTNRNANIKRFTDKLFIIKTKRTLIEIIELLRMELQNVPSRN